MTHKRSKTGLIIGLWLGAAISAMAGVGVVGPTDATPRERLAAAEIVRYVYLRTGALPAAGAVAGEMDTTIVLTRDPARLGPQQFEIKTTGQRVVITGGDDIGVLYGAYRYCEKLGVRFYLHGDVVPDERLPALPLVNEIGKPLFALRGLNPWGSHPFGFDAWGTDDYKAIIGQLAKMRMNFLGIHCYPEGHPYAEPTVWLGVREDFDPQGRVQFSYPTHYFNTLSKGVWGGYFPKKTGDYSFGGAQMFADEAWAPEAMREHCPLPATPESCNDVFNRLGAQFRDAFGWARELGVKTAVGTETPLIMPQALRARLKQQGKNPDDPATVHEVYEGMFRRIAATHPLDYFWLWTPEDWTWGGNKPAEYTNTVRDAKIANEALRASGASFKLATCGWVLGPQHDRAAFDADLPKDIPMSAISREIGKTAVDPAFAKVAGREKWAISWLEGDGDNGLAAIQLWAGRMRKDAADALRYGCTGLMGLQWRTSILSPNVSALAQAAWDQSGWNAAPVKSPPEPSQATKTIPPRFLPCDDFYGDWATANFGSAAGADIGRVFASVDGRLPASVNNDCPSGSLAADSTPWATVAATYGCVTELENLRARIQSAGNVARFNYWLNMFRYHRALHQLRCVLAEFDALLKGRRNDAALVKYKELLTLYGETYRCLLSTVDSPGALAMVVNLENHPGFWTKIVDEPARKLSAALGHPLPEDLKAPKAFQGEPRIIVPTVRSTARKGETLVLTFIVLDNQPAKSVMLAWRPLGQGEFGKLPAQHVARSVYRVTLPLADGSFEYRLEAVTTGGKPLVWPMTAPAMNQTVVTW